MAVTGGLGGLGLLVASWMVSTGAAKRVLLLGRTGKIQETSKPNKSRSGSRSGSDTHSSSTSAACWLALTSSGAEVITMAADTSIDEDASSVAGLIGVSAFPSHESRRPAAAATSGWSVDAVIHAAGVLTDAMLPNQTLTHLKRYQGVTG